MPADCAACGGPVDPELDYCEGCGRFVCDACLGAAPRPGPHELEAHAPREDTTSKAGAVVAAEPARAPSPDRAPVDPAPIAAPAPITSGTPGAPGAPTPESAGASALPARAGCHACAGLPEPAPGEAFDLCPRCASTYLTRCCA